MKLFDFKGKTAVITGASSGIGQAIAQLFAQQGAMVCLVGLNKELEEKAASEIRKAGGKAETFLCDVSSQREVRSVFEQINEKCGFHILVNNAGIAHVGTVETTSEYEFDRVFQVNVKGVYNCMHFAIPYLKKQGGVILNLASVASLVGIPERFAYSMSKGAVLTMSMSVAKDYLRDNIRCNCISPSRVHTPFVDSFLAKKYQGKEDEMFRQLSESQPIGRMAKPEEIAHLALYLCSDEASYITGCNYPIDGGFSSLNN